MKATYQKKSIICIILLALMYSILSKAQAPQSFPYQSVLRDAAGNLIASQNVSLRFSILSGGATGTLVYQETQNALTNNLGLFDVNIGQGTVTSGTFSAINWGSGSKYLKIELDANGGNNFVVMDNAQLLSVPYALYANTSNSTNNAHYIGESYGGGIVFYVYDNGQHGLIGALQNLNNSVPWSFPAVGNAYPYFSGIGAGYKNTLLLMAGTSFFTNPVYQAANWGETTGQNGEPDMYDWYLPSKTELQLLYNQKTLFSSWGDIYWSSTLSNGSQFYCINFTSGVTTPKTYTESHYARAIRRF